MTKNVYTFPSNGEPVLQTKSSRDVDEPSSSMINQETPLSFIDQKMIQAYGVPLTNTEGEWKNNMWENIWKQIVNLSGKLYT